MKIFAYIRVSTDEQAERGNSLIEQRDRLENFAKRFSDSEPVFFIDDGASAKDLKRKELTRMLERIKEGGPGMVITTKLDRLSRRLVNTLSVVEFFDKYNFRYATEAEHFDTTTSAGMMTFQQLGTFAEFERARISERVRDNLHFLARNTKRVISRPCFGYDIIDKKMVINEEEARIVRQMFEWALKGEGPSKIAGKLNAMGVKTKGGKQWYDRGVRTLLTSESLTGDFVYCKTTKKNGKLVKRDESEWIRVSEHHEAIVDRATFEKSLAFFEGRKQIGRHVSSERYLLSGMVYCAHCGHKMNGGSWYYTSRKTNVKEPRKFYICTGYSKKRVCFFHRISNIKLENLILDRVREIAESSAEDLNLEVAHRKSEPVDILLIEAQIEKLNKTMQKQIDAYNEDLIEAEDLKRATEKVKAERKELQKMLTEASKSSSEKVKKELVKKAKEHQFELSSDNLLKTKNYLRQIIDRIEISNASEVKVIWRVD